MAEQGVVTAVEQRAEGSATAAAAAAGDAVLVVEYAGDFDDAGGTLQVAGQTIAYTAVVDGTEPDDPDTIELSAPLAAAVGVGEPVNVMSGDQIAYEFVAHVSVDDAGDTAEVVIPYADRAFWTVGPYEPPVPVVVSDDLTQILEVPGRTPTPDITVGDPNGARVEITSDGVFAYDNTGLNTFAVDTAGDVGTLGEIGTAPPDEVGMFMFSTKFGKIGAQQTNLVFQFNTGANDAQPSIQAWTADASNLRLFSGRNTSSEREATLQLDNGGILLGIEQTPTAQDYGLGARLQVDNDGYFLASRNLNSFGSTMGPYLDGGHGGTTSIMFGLRNSDGSQLHAIQLIDNANVRVLSKNDFEVVSATGLSYRDIFCNSVNPPSDRRLKTDLAAPEASGLDALRAMPVYAYRLKAEVADPERDAPLRLGVMTDDVPEHLRRPLGIDPKASGVDLYGLVALLAQAVQELDRECDTFREKKPRRKGHRGLSK